MNIPPQTPGADVPDPSNRGVEPLCAPQAQLRQARKLEALGTLAGGIAHDFNNILTAILLNRELALMAIDNPEELRARLSDIGHASLRAKALVAQILAFSQQREPELRKSQPLGPVVAEAMTLVRAATPASVEIATQLAADCPPVAADATQVHQIVLNLCANAEYAMRGRTGQLRVTLEPVMLSTEDCRDQPDLRAGPHVRLSISDTGSGMSDATVARIFDPFFTTKPEGEGTGLGLAIVQRIVREHAGSIHVRSQLNVGTTFEILFPTATAPFATNTLAPRPLARGHGERVLIVDDEEQIGRGLQLLLTRIGYTAKAFTDPEAALHALRAEPAATDVALLDLTMPRMNGPELLRRLREVRPELPAILMSGDRGTAAAAATTHCEFLQKPIELPALSLALRRALGG